MPPGGVDQIVAEAKSKDGLPTFDLAMGVEPADLFSQRDQVVAQLVASGGSGHPAGEAESECSPF